MKAWAASEAADPNTQKVTTAMTQTSAVSSTVSFMPRNVPTHGTPFQRQRRVSPSVRLAQVYKVAKPKTAAALYIQSCERVAQGNEVYLAAGQADTVMAHMAQIDASMGSQIPVDLMTALHEAELTDCDEQRPDETFREKLRRGEATVADGETYINKSALARYKAEQAERAVRTWITEQKGGE
jgi:hypothetical protein